MSRSRQLTCAALLALVVGLAPASSMAEGGGGAMQLYRDPDTGAVGVPPPAAPARQVAPAAAVTTAPAAALMTEPEPVAGPAGGMRLSFDPRLRAAVTRRAGTGPLHECTQSSAANGSAR